VLADGATDRGGHDELAPAPTMSTRWGVARPLSSLKAMRATMRQPRMSRTLRRTYKTNSQRATARSER